MLDIIAIVSGVLLIITGILLVIMILMQESKRNGMAALTGGDSYYDQNNTRTKERTIYRISKVLVIVFFVLTFAANLALMFIK